MLCRSACFKRLVCQVVCFFVLFYVLSPFAFGYVKLEREVIFSEGGLLSFGTQGSLVNLPPRGSLTVVCLVATD